MRHKNPPVAYRGEILGIDMTCTLYFHIIATSMQAVKKAVQTGEAMTTYIITGATGYIGSALIKFILEAGQAGGENTPFRIIALVRDRQKASVMLPEGVELVQTDLCDRRCAEQMLEVGREVDYVIHCASITKSAEMIAHPVEVTESIVNTTQNILEFARRASVKSMVYLSSMEVYGNIDCRNGQRVKEEEVCRGELEVLNVRSCYPLGKRMAENICFSYYKEYGVPVKIARLAQTFGHGILPEDNRVFAQFARAVQNGEDIVLYTNGGSIGNYCDIGDSVRGIMTILKKGTDGEAYNIVNEKNTMTIQQMAELVAEQVANGKIKVKYEISDDNSRGYASDTGLQMSGQKLEDLGWKPQKLLCDMYRNMI